MFGIGGTELVIILIFGFLLFGPDKLPQMGRTIGRAIRQFRNAQEQMNKVVRAEVYDPLSDSEPLKDLSSLFSGSSSPKAVASSQSASVDSGDKAPKKPKINPVKPLAPAGETFAQKKARLAREKAERDLALASAQVAASKAQTLGNNAASASKAGASDGCDASAPHAAVLDTHRSSEPQEGSAPTPERPTEQTSKDQVDNMKGGRDA